MLTVTAKFCCLVLVILQIGVLRIKLDRLNIIGYCSVYKRFFTFFTFLGTTQAKDLTLKLTLGLYLYS